MLKSIQGKNGTFDFEVEENYKSVLGNGYIITKEGYFIYVEEHHADTFTSFLNKYFGCGIDNYTNKRWESTDGAVALAREGMIVYWGIKISDKKIDTNTNIGNGVLVLPDGDLTQAQEDSLLDLLRTNKSVFHPTEPIMLLSIARVEDFVHSANNAIPEEELINYLSGRQRERETKQI